MPASPNSACQSNQWGQAVRPGSMKAKATRYSFRFVFFWNESISQSRNEECKLINRICITIWLMIEILRSPRNRAAVPRDDKIKGAPGATRTPNRLIRRNGCDRLTHIYGVNRCH